MAYVITLIKIEFLYSFEKIQNYFGLSDQETINHMAGLVPPFQPVICRESKVDSVLDILLKTPGLEEALLMGDIITTELL